MRSSRFVVGYCTAGLGCYVDFRFGIFGSGDWVLGLLRRWQSGWEFVDKVVFAYLWYRVLDRGDLLPCLVIGLLTAHSMIINIFIMLYR